MQPIDASAPITVTLQAQQWNVVLAALNEAPYRIAAPLIAAIGEQLQAHAPRPNAAVEQHHASD